MNNPQKPLLKFPCQFPIKVMGYASPNFEEMAFQVVKNHVPELDKTCIRSRASKDGKYLALTFKITAQSKEQLDKIYLDLNACDNVVMCL